MKIEEKVYAKEEETRQLQPRTQEKNADCSFDLCCAMCRKRKKLRSNSYGEISISKQLPFLPSIVNLTTAHKKSRFLRVQKLMYLINIKGKEEAEIKQLRRNLNFKATPMPAFYREPGHRSEKNKDGQIWEDTGARAVVRGRWGMDREREILDVLRANTELASKTKSQSSPSTAARARATSPTENTVRCLRAEIYNRCSTNECLNMADSPQVSEVTIHPSADLSYSNVPSAATS
ncbi:hypothetical protein T459_04352 [Capsicum annuum]|uniref:TPX2 C-terminal domain-containing protein n=1 Tax=Capsicum annuum TaxID=4072 RepID=A0A2G3A4R3_CAPAN|nr:hypothetical protein T459_04352 [Capsicum annuum]